MSARRLSRLSRLSLGMVALIEKGDQRLTQTAAEKIARAVVAGESGDPTTERAIERVTAWLLKGRGEPPIRLRVTDGIAAASFRLLAAEKSSAEARAS